MKAFANITLGQVSKALTEISNMPNALSGNQFPSDVNWEAVAEYIYETFGSEYDAQDREFVLDNVWFDEETHNIYAIEVQEDENGIEQLVIETIYNPYA